MNLNKIIKKSNLSEKIIQYLNLFFSKEKIDNFEDKLFLNNFLTINIQSFILFCFLAGGILSILLMFLLFYIQIDYQRIIIFGFLIFLIPFFAFYLIQDVLFERNKRKKEYFLSELILEISVFVDDTSLIKLINEISKMDFPYLQKDFEFVNLQIKNGGDVGDAIKKIQKMNKSKEIDRFFDVLLQGYYSGGKLSKLLNELAEEMLQNRAIIRERQAVMLVTKYTLLLASVLIVPILLGLIITLVSGLNISFGTGEYFEIGLSMDERTNLFNLTVLGVQIYIVQYALISSFFLAIQEGNKKNFFLYSIILVPLAIIFFFIGTIL